MGGATAANQLEGAYLADGKGLSVADAMPGGKQRFAILEMKRLIGRLTKRNIATLIIQELITMIALKRTLRCLLKWASNVIAFQLRGRVFFHKEMKHNRMKPA